MILIVNRNINRFHRDKGKLYREKSQNIRKNTQDILDKVLIGTKRIDT